MTIGRLVALLLICLVQILCVGVLLEADEEFAPPPGYDGGARFKALPGAVRVTVRLIDAETRRPVPRLELWVHGFNDAIDAQSSLWPGDERSTFELWLPEPEVRLRIADRTDQYELFERRFVAEGQRLDLEVELQPTHWIRLHGRVLWDDGGTLRPVGFTPPRKVGNPMISIGPSGEIDRDGEGRYSVRVPREELTTNVVSSALRVHPPRLDLRGATETERELDLVLRDD
jgi:hypothetical protein